MLLVAVMVLPMAGLLLSADEAYAAGDVTFTGIAQDSDGNPLGDVEVRLDWTVGDTDFAVSGTAHSNVNDGSFSIALPGTYDDSLTNTVTISYRNELHIMICDDIILEDYTISGTTFDLGGVKAPHVYTKDKNMTVMGTVKYGSELISGATVSLLKSNGAVVGTDTTGADGKYEIRCEPGTYTITVERGGFEDQTIDGVVVGEDSSSTTKDINLVLAPEQTYWGLDLPHLFAVVGLIMAGILLMIVMAYIVYTRGHRGKLKITDDED